MYTRNYRVEYVRGQKRLACRLIFFLSCLAKTPGGNSHMRTPTGYISLTEACYFHYQSSKVRTGPALRARLGRHRHWPDPPHIHVRSRHVVTRV